MRDSCNILLCGVGGQGIVLASKLIAQAAIADGLCARTAETIGMAQRGGCVVSHVRIGKEVWSPLVSRGGADFILSFEPAEAVRNLIDTMVGNDIYHNLPINAQAANEKSIGQQINDMAYGAYTQALAEINQQIKQNLQFLESFQCKIFR